MDGWQPFSLVVDDIGIYYDTSCPSRLENLILSAEQMLPETLENAEKAIDWIVAHKLSKYNHAPDFERSGFARGTLPEKETVLVIDQTYGDMAVQYGGADTQTFTDMFQAALAENPNAEIWVKTHPDVLSGKKQGYLTALPDVSGSVRLLAEDVNPLSLLEKVDKVYCVTSQMGFEALLLGKPVSVFGLPWYAGWGVSDDRHPQIADLKKQNRRQPRSLTQLFAAAYLQYSRYINPNTGESGTIFDVLAHLTLMRRLNNTLRGDIYCIGMSLWKRAVVKSFFRLPSCRLHFAAAPEYLPLDRLPENSRIVLWGQGKPEWQETAGQHQIPLLRMEDGFVRSVGLGSNLVPALSLVVDDLGIYFNPRQPSRLETILQQHPFTESDRTLARQLRDTLINHRISKYNVGTADLHLPDTGQTIILVPGQVEDDASIRLGAPEIKTNADLLAAVRQARPDAYIIYKPHPDVLSGNRIGAIDGETVSRLADHIETQADIAACLNAADEVHTMTSLSGFEALLRGKKVCCYGLPFYAGWGLTEDKLHISRRTRRLSLEELISGTLVYYPQYANPENGNHINVQTALAILRKQRERQPSGSLKRSWAAKQLGKLYQLWRLFR